MEKSDFSKFLEIDNKHLYTPVILYTRGDFSVTAFGMIHIAEKKYYENIQDAINGFEEGFFEGIKSSSDEVTSEFEKKELKEKQEKSRDPYRVIAKCMGMVYQGDHLKYGKKWDNPDMSQNELNAHFGGKNIFDDLLGGMDYPLKMLEKTYEKNPEAVKSLYKQTATFIYKLPLVSEILMYVVQGPKFMDVVLNQRNQMLFDGMKPMLDNYDNKNVAVTYGAAHLSGLENFLVENGFEKNQGFWLPAWDMDCKMSIFEAFKSMNESMADEDYLKDMFDGNDMFKKLFGKFKQNWPFK